MREKHGGSLGTRLDQQYHDSPVIFTNKYITPPSPHLRYVFRVVLFPEHAFQAGEVVVIGVFVGSWGGRNSESRDQKFDFFQEREKG